jgi:hypothetical protein
MGAELKRVGAFDPLSPDKRGRWKMAAAPLPGIELKDGSMQEGFFTFGPPESLIKTPVSSPVKGVAGMGKANADAPKTVRIDQMMMDLRIRPSQALPVIREVLKIVFETATIRVDRFRLSLGELVGLAKHDETFLIPHHTNDEQRFMHALRALCAKHLDLLLRSHQKEDFQDFASFPNWKKDCCELMARVMQSMPDWRSRALQIFWNLNRKMLVMRGEADTKGHHKRQEVNLFAEVRLLTSNPEYADLEQEVRKNKLDAEQYDRLLIIHKRDRQHLRSEMEQHFENSLLPKRSDTGSDDVDRPSLALQQAQQREALKEKEKGQEIARQSVSATPPAGPPKAVMIEAAPAAALDEQKRKPLDGITRAELLDTPCYWYDDRLALGHGHPDDKLSLKMNNALKQMIRDKEEFHFERGKKGEEIMTSKMLAYKTLNRKRGNMSAQNSLGFVSMVQQNAGVVPGRIVDEDSMMGASRGACSFRLVPSFEQHDKKPTHHPTSRPPSASIRSIQQFFDIQEVLKKPSVDGKGKSLKLGAPMGIHRQPTATPRAASFRKAVAMRSREQPGARDSPETGQISSHATAVSPFPAEPPSPGGNLDDTVSDGSPLASTARSALSPSSGPQSISPTVAPVSRAISPNMSQGIRPASPSLHRISARPD